MEETLVQRIVQAMALPDWMRAGAYKPIGGICSCMEIAVATIATRNILCTIQFDQSIAAATF